ncbi:hypothetical protein PA905_47500 [Planktothrix agardhii CCAP 1459/11A]|jgi:virginiamycin A acetyltransferase|uniref:Uncharacterized protein n=1 Tax=Planktothrix agardhii CCAP 1459/11A TaxID=282420 RepID=A0A4P5ZJ56_PLAAG|nr:hypothetical protein PA905_47500 [Planktothrix agardhii CCAP 1459/11A]CAD5919933.1 Virginiamycin A acetyltransferase [Planktothrix rubescens]CAH2572843.1 Virginiamycin A acetyltransferase [Planktothrix rubescens]
MIKMLTLFPQKIMNYGPSPQTRYPIPEQTRLVYLKTIIKKRKYGDW